VLKRAHSCVAGAINSSAGISNQIVSVWTYLFSGVKAAGGSVKL
jgi:hypothetical protein